MQTVICTCWSAPITAKIVKEPVVACELAKLGSLLRRDAPLIGGILVAKEMGEAKALEATRIARLELLAHAVVAKYLRIRALACHQIEGTFLLALTFSQVGFNKTAFTL